MSNKLFRRQFLKVGIGSIAGAVSTTLFSNFSNALAESEYPPFCPPSGCPPLPIPNAQENWRYCNKCQSMFYLGAEGSSYEKRRGVCAAGGVHEPAGYNFVLPHDVPGTPTAQTDWRYCNKCQSMFYLGAEGSSYEKRRGVCAAGGVHEPAGYNFVLPWYTPTKLG